MQVSFCCMEIWTLWHPNYWSSGVLKAITALISLYTALALIPIIPKAISLPSSTQLKEANQILESEIAERQRAEQRLSLQSSTALVLAESSSLMTEFLFVNWIIAMLSNLAFFVG
jgi:two-component system, LuxR family, sensor kinase FixL